MINFIQTRILITHHHSCRRAGLAQFRASRCLFHLRNAMEEGFLATKAKIRTVAKALCFRACTDCKSADECDPDENWIEEARATLERPSMRGLVDDQKALSISTVPVAPVIREEKTSCIIMNKSIVHQTRQ